MQFIYEIVKFKDLTSTERAILALRNEDFYCCRRYNSAVKINKDLPNIEDIIKIAEDMWKFDRLLDSADSDLMNDLWLQLKAIAGKDAADQIYRVWSEALNEKLDREAKAAAKQWVNSHDVADELDAFCDIGGTYDPRFIQALWGETIDTSTIFLYGCQIGMEAARKAASV